MFYDLDDDIGEEFDNRLNIIRQALYLVVFKTKNKEMEVICLVGISGSGKTTLGKILAEKLNYQFIDLDSFYLKDKPKTRLSNGKEINNWDSLKALDIVKFQTTILQYSKVVVAGFALIDEILPVKPKASIWLKTGIKEEEIINRCLENRSKSKNFTLEKQEEDKLMVNEIVYPYFINYLSQTTITAVICIYEGEKRREIQELVNTILDWLS